MTTTGLRLPRAVWIGAATLCGVLCCADAWAELKLPAIFGDNMVLQRQTEAPIWGWATPGESVEVAADWTPTAFETTADQDGKWLVSVPTAEAGGPHTLSIRGDGAAVTFKNVMIGEVWVCSGQSNMEWPMKLVLNAEQELAAANRPAIRLFNVEHAIALSPHGDCKGVWRVSTPETVGDFSAVAYFFARELQRELDVPIGLIGSNWGGTVVEAWTSEDVLATYPDFADQLGMIHEERKAPGTLARKQEIALNEWRRGFEELETGSPANGGWMRVDFDDSEWKPFNVPDAWDADDLKDFDGVVWFRREVEIPDAWRGKDLTLSLGPIDDIDSTWFNGVKVGGMEAMNKWYVPRQYSIPAAAVNPGRNLIAVRVYDFYGPGGMRGKPEQLSLRPAADENAATPIPLAGQWRYRVGVEHDKLPALPPASEFHQNSPTALFNGMISPLIPYAIRGAIWYQGESNIGRAEQYRRLFPAMIGDWRRRWGCGDFPFYYVQIAPFRYGGDTGQAALLREAQFQSLETPNVGMAVTLDIGNPADIHPRNKQEVGRRLALWALAKTFGRDDVVYSGPLYRSMRVEGGAIRLEFDHIGGGLAPKDEPLTCFTIAGEDRAFVEAQATIDGDTVVVRGDRVPSPIAVRFAWGAADQPNLRNAEGLPASSFRTDGWAE